MIIYKITNLINQKIYIGLTTLSVERRWAKHIKDYKRNTYNSNLYKAFKKYGIQNFEIKQIDFCFSLKELSDKEIFWIKKLDSTNPTKGYNILTGGITFNSDNSLDWWNRLSLKEKEMYCQKISKRLQGIK